MVVVDCNVLVHLLLEGEQTPRARGLLEHDPDWHSAALLMVELTKVLATTISVRKLAMKDAAMVLTQTDSIGRSFW